ncbi:hypothetical protein MHYP_G00193670 [Metynnis hypsauchen]
MEFTPYLVQTQRRTTDNEWSDVSPGLQLKDRKYAAVLSEQKRNRYASSRDRRAFRVHARQPAVRARDGGHSGSSRRGKAEPGCCGSYTARFTPKAEYKRRQDTSSQEPLSQASPHEDTPLLAPASARALERWRSESVARITPTARETPDGGSEFRH